jgi:hypothetical protein
MVSEEPRSPESRKRRLGHPVPGRYKYGDLALQVRGVSNIGTIKYGSEFCGTWTREGLLWQGPEAIVQ